MIHRLHTTPSAHPNKCHPQCPSPIFPSLPLPHQPSVCSLYLGVFYGLPPSLFETVFSPSLSPMGTINNSQIVECPSTDKWIKMWFIDTVDYYLAMRKNEIWPFATTWMELEGIMLSEISQSEKYRYHMFSLIRGT